ncbi:MAG TPA: flavoprotein [Streptosporangiaceae bacterium]|nr:flavoprotein [Streptosporangiaceae bacterium]
MATGVLYLVCCAAPPALHAEELVVKAQARGWDVCVICTPTAARWLRDRSAWLEILTGHPVRSQYKLPGEPDVLPPADAMLVTPATANTIAKWALGVSDTLALGLITEAIGLRLPVAALPHLNAAQASHPAFAGHVETLRAAGVAVLLGPDGQMLAGSDPVNWDAALDELDRRISARQG